MSDPLPLFERGDPHLQLHNKERELINELLEGGGGGGVEFPTLGEAYEDLQLVFMSIEVPDGETEGQLGTNVHTGEKDTTGLKDVEKLTWQNAAYSAKVADNIRTGLYRVVLDYSGDESINGSFGFNYSNYPVSQKLETFLVLRPGAQFQLSVNVSETVDFGGNTTRIPVSGLSSVSINATPLILA